MVSNVGGKIEGESNFREPISYLMFAVFAIQNQSFNNFENDVICAMKLSVNEPKLTGCELGTVLLFNWF